jgi:diketogulonate reductase-like aldo/keto reductase
MAQLVVRGIQVPSFCYGTAWKEERTEELTALALGAGFRAIDTANQRRHYVEAGVGTALGRFLAAGAIRRDELFLQTKFTFARGQDHRLPYDASAPIRHQVEQSFASSLEHLGTPYIDSYVLHGPMTARGLHAADVEAWRTMEAIQASGRTRLLGISNVSLDQLRDLLDLAAVAPAFVQNRCYARDGWDGEIRSFCREHEIIYQGFSLLTANRRELQGAAFDAILQRTGRTRAQLVFRFALQVGMMPLTGTSSLDHMREDLAAFDFELTAADVAAIEAISSATPRA